MEVTIKHLFRKNYCSRFSTEIMNESQEADSNGFSEEFNIMSRWMVETLGNELYKMYISFIGGDDDACLPCLLKLTKLWNCKFYLF